MFRFVFRLCAAFVVPMLLALTSLCACAQGQVYLAVDKQEVLPLTCAIAYRVEQEGATVRMHNIARPNDAPFYASGSSTTLEQAAEAFQSRRVKAEDLEDHLADFLTAFFRDTEFTDEDTDVVVITNFDRGKLVFGSWDTEKNTFRRTALKRAYEAVCAALDAHPNLSVTIWYASYNEVNNGSAVDDRLMERYADRFSYHVLPDGFQVGDTLSHVFTSSDFASPEFIVSDSSFASRELPDTLPADGTLRYDYDVMGKTELLRLSFPGDAQPSGVCFTLEHALPDDGSASTAYALTPSVSLSPSPIATDCPPDAQILAQDDESVGSSSAGDKVLRAFYDATSQAYWVYLPSAQAGDKIVITGQHDATQEVTYALTAWSSLPVGDFLLIPDGQSHSVRNDQFTTMPSETTRWTLGLYLPGFTVDDITTITLSIAVDGEETGAAARLVGCSTRDGVCRWIYELPVLAPHSTGTIRASYGVWNQDSSGTLSVRFQVDNRAPTLAEGVEDPVKMDAYFDLPATGLVPDATYQMRIDLSEYFVDADQGDTLTFSCSSRNATKTSSYSQSISDGILVYQPKQLDLPVQLTISASDESGESANLTFEFNHISVRNALNQLSLTPDAPTAALQEGNRFLIPIGEARTLRFTLPREDEEAIDAMLSFFHLGTLEECLVVDAGEMYGAFIRGEDGLLTLSIDVPPVDHATQLSYPLGIKFVGKESSVQSPFSCIMDLPMLSDASIDVQYVNNPPRLREGIVTDNTLINRDIDGAPGHYTPVALSALCDSSQTPVGTLRLDALFENDESIETLTYTFTVSSGCIRIVAANGTALSGNLTAGAQWSPTLEQVSQDIDIHLLTPGEHAFDISAQDTIASAAEAIVYRVELASSFMRRLIIGTIVTFLLIVALIVTLVICHMLKPAFGGAHVAINHICSASRDAFSYPGAMIDVPLCAYGKRSVSLIALLAAAGIPLPRAFPPEALARIAIAPGKRRTYIVSRGRSDAVLLVDGRTASGRNVKLEDGQTLYVHFGSPQIVLALRLYSQRD